MKMYRVGHRLATQWGLGSALEQLEPPTLLGPSQSLPSIGTRLHGLVHPTLQS